MKKRICKIVVFFLLYLFMNQKKELIACGYLSQKESRNLHIPSYIRKINKYAFVNWGLLHVTIPSSVVEIEENAFFGSGVRKISFVGKTSGIKTVSQKAFAYTALRTIHLSQGVKRIESEAFRESDRIQAIYIPPSCTRISKNLFGKKTVTKKLMKTQVTIYGERGSYAEHFAGANGYKYKEWRT